MDNNQWFYSAATGGFYSTADHGENIPEDAKEISKQYRDELLAGDAAGMVIAQDDDGIPVLALRPAPTLEQVVAVYRQEIQAHLDAAAVVAGYDDIRTAVTYAEEPAVPKFQAEGLAFRAWRSLVWDYAYAQLDAVNAGEREQPTVKELLDELPELVLPA